MKYFAADFERARQIYPAWAAGGQDTILRSYAAVQDSRDISVSHRSLLVAWRQPAQAPGVRHAPKFNQWLRFSGSAVGIVWSGSRCYWVTSGEKQTDVRILVASWGSRKRVLPRPQARACSGCSPRRRRPSWRRRTRACHSRDTRAGGGIRTGLQA